MKTLNQITGKLVAVIFVLSSINASGRPREPWPPLPEFAPVLYHESFDEVYSYCTTNAYWVVPDYGTLIESWSGYALERAGDVTPFVVPGLDAAGHTNITAEGALRFWVKPYWSSAPDGKGPGKDARLVELLAVGNKQVLVIFSLQVNADGTVLSLVSESDKGPMNLMKSEICWPAGQWHQVVLNHGPKATTLHVDGELVGESEPVLTLPPQAAALVWGSTADGTDSFEGEFEELYTFSKPLEVALYYSAFKNQAALGPISLEEEKALAEAAARWRAEHKSEGGGSEMRLLVGGTSECITNVPVYITNLVAFFDTNQGWTVTFDIQGSYDGTTTALYDVFTTTNLVGDNGTNSQWVWLERGPSCSTYQYTNQAEAVSFYLVGTPLDSDGDGFTDAYERLVSHSDPNVPDAPVILFQPLSQTVEQGDTATFTVIADGAQPLSYQWLRGGTNIVGETNNWLTFTAVDSSQADDYSVQVTSSAALSTLSSNATLMVQYADNWPLVTVVGPRQDYTFKNGTTYYIDSRVELYGTTTIEGGAIIKPAWYYPDSTLAIMGKLVCKTEDAYFPAFITSVDDDTVGDAFYDSSGTPEAISNGVPYLDLTFAQDASPALDNLRIRYADQGVGTPTNKRLNVWNCQFVGCNSAVIANKDATVSFHNVLFGDCGTAVAGATNFTAIEGEHVTADVTNFWTQVSPTWIKLTNSLVIGTLGSGPTFVTDHSAINPSGSVFQPAGSGRYYLTNTSSYVRTGTTNISPRLLTEFRQKTTQPPLIFPEMLQIAGDLTLGQQVARYTNGAPDYGYYYPALDYTVAWMTVRGNITMLPGTAIGFRSEYSAALGHDTWWGFDMREGSSFSSRGTPSRPNIFTDVQMVQEQLASACIASFVPDFWPNDSGNVAPSLDFRFSNFYANSHWYHAWSGYDAAIQYLFAPDSLVNWNMRDCNLHGGRITLGQPDDGSFYGAPPDWFYGACAVSWVNNLFDGVAIDLDPTFYRFDLGMNCDMAFEAYNNLFRGGLWFHLEPIPATAGNWVFKDNLFDKVDFVQNTNAPLDFNYNGYWPLSASELNWAWYSYPWYDFNSGQLLVTTNGGGGNEQVMAVAPEYQNGVFGNHYLPITSALYGAGSRAPGDAGLAQYTTRVDQTKEGDETTGHMVNIGLHYVVAGTNSVPKDFDGDGIPDFVEDANGSGQWDEGVETKIDNAYTTTGVLDSTNSIYDDVDLDGDDLTGRAERILVTSPLIADNPLTLTPVITGEEPFILTYSIPLSGDVSTNRCMLALLDNGVAAGGYEFIQQSNNTYQVKWNTTFAPNALHFLQVELVMPGSRLPKNIPGAQPVLFVHGPARTESVNNLIQFDPDMCSFGSQASFYGTLQVQSADYEIEIYDTTNNLLKTITNHTDTGVLDEVWDLTTDTNQPPRADEEFFAQLYITPNGLTRSGPIPIWKFKEGNCGDLFTLAYGWNNQSYQFFRSLMVRMAVSDIVFAPYLENQYYNTSLNCWNCDPYFMYTTNEVPALLSDLTSPTVGNFFWNGHGSSVSIGSAGENEAENRTNSLSEVGCSDVGYALGNFRKRGGLKKPHPYRLVILDCCSSGVGTSWAEAFGIDTGSYDRAWYQSQNRTARAMVGWTRDTYQPADVMGMSWYGTSLSTLFSLWMSEWPLSACLREASNPVTFMKPLDPSWKIFGCTNMTRSLQ